MTLFPLKTIVLALSVALIARAQEAVEASEASRECSREVKGMSQADLDAIRMCKTFTGTILLDNTPAEQLSLEGVEELTGDLILQGNAALKTFSAPHLKSVSGQLSVINHLQMEKLDLPSLTAAKGITLSVLPNLENIKFPAGLSKVEDLTIDDTRAPGIQGLTAQTLHSLTVTQNNYLKQFDLPAKEMTGSIFVTGNGKGLDFEAVNLASVQNATFRQLSKLNVPALTRVASDISFHQNEFSSLSMDNLEFIGGTMTIANNDALTDTSFKVLTRVGGALSVGNNTRLQTIGGFPQLTDVTGTIDMAGSFEKFDIPQLQDVRGGLRIQTTSDKFPCPELESKLKTTGVVKGSIWGCQSSMDASKMDPTVGQKAGGSMMGDGSGSGSGSSGSSNGKSSNPQMATSAGVMHVPHGSWFAFAAGLVYTLYF